MLKLTLIFIAGLLLSFNAIAQLTARQERNLTAFTKLYGYVHYFYPGDEAQQIDWNNLAVYGAGEVINLPDDRALMEKLKTLYLPVAPAIKIEMGNHPISFNKQEITPRQTKNFKVISWQHKGYGLWDSNGTYASIRLNRRSAVSDKKIEESEFIPLTPQVDVDQYAGKDFVLVVKLSVLSKVADVRVKLLRDSLVGVKMLLKNDASEPVTDASSHEYRFKGVFTKDKKIVIGFLRQQQLKINLDSVHLFVNENGKLANIPLQKPVNYDALRPYVGLRRYALFVDNDTPDEPLFEKRAQIGESIRAELVKGINCMVPLALYGTTHDTYPCANPAALAALQQGIASAQKLDKNSQAIHLADMMIAWNVFQHFFTYWDDASKSPQVILHDALTKAAADKTETDIFYTQKLMCAALNDGHMFYDAPGSPGTRNDYSAPLVFTKAEGHIIIKYVLDSTLNNKIHAGDIVDSLAGKEALSYFNARLQYLSGSPQVKEYNMLTLLPDGPPDTTLNLAIRHNGLMSSLKVPRTAWGIAYREGSFSLKPVPDGELKNGIYYYNLSDKSVDSIIDSHITRLVQAKALILDMRGYPKSDLMMLIRCLLVKKDTTKWMHIPLIIYPDHQKFSYFGEGWNLKPVLPHISAKIYLLIDASAMSASESYSGFFKDFKLATVIGLPTAGTNGNLNAVELPGNRGQFFTGMLVTDHYGGKHHLKGIVPDVIVHPTIQGIADGRDEILEKAISLAEAQQ